MEIIKSGSQPSGKGPAEYFTGTVRIDPLISPPEPSRVVMALVTFEPGARTAWHTHPFGQTLIVTAGGGWGGRGRGTKKKKQTGRGVFFFFSGKNTDGGTKTKTKKYNFFHGKKKKTPPGWVWQGYGGKNNNNLY